MEPTLEPTFGAHNLLWDMFVSPGMNSRLRKSRLQEPRFQKVYILFVSQL